MIVKDIPVVPLDEATEFFFEGAMKCYCGGAEKKTEIEFPGRVTYSHIRADGKFLYVDQYNAPELSSGGTTTMYVAYKNGMWLPFWMMFYDGWEASGDKKVIAFLKKALVDAYTRKEFCGGRGPKEFYGCEYGSTHRSVNINIKTLFGPDNFCYINEYCGDFTNFNCQETIDQDNGTVLHTLVFSHRVSGRALIPLK